MTVSSQIAPNSVSCLNLIGQLLAAFDLAGIQYVHWKSNTNIAKALDGADDLDILVKPDHRERAEAVFRALRINRALSSKDGWQRDIYHLVGLDRDSGALVHVHVHYALPVGFDYDKNFVLPIVDAYLEGRWRFGPVYLPQVEMEYVVLVLRLIIKNAMAPMLLQLPHRLFYKIKTAKTHGVISGGGYAEFVDLSARSDRKKIDALLSGPLAFIGPEQFAACEAALLSNREMRTFFRTAASLKASLRPYGTNSEPMSIAKAFIRLTGERFGKLRAKLLHQAPRNRRSALGGRLIAFVGGDGAGKSTNVALLSKTLAKMLDVRCVHIGRPKRSLVGVLIRILRSATRWLGLRAHADAFNYLAIAFDRRVAFHKAKKWRNSGTIVIVDRVPLPGITQMDCPRIHGLAHGRFKRLARWEAKLHEDIRGVDALVVLKLDPTIALARRPEDDAAKLLRRSGEIWEEQWQAPYARVIDTGAQGLEEVRREVLDIAWNCISRPFARIEVVGLNGSGKSTLTNLLRKRIPNVQTSLPFWSYPWTSLAGAMKGIPTALRAFRRSRNFQVAKNCLQLFASASLSRKLAKNYQPATHLIFDQGPYFQFALAHREGALSSNGYCEATKATGWVATTVRLTAPIDELYKRVVNRPSQGGRGQILAPQTFAAFVESYELSFDFVLGQSSQSITVDATRGAEEILSELLKLLPQ